MLFTSFSENSIYLRYKRPYIWLRFRRRFRVRRCCIVNPQQQGECVQWRSHNFHWHSETYKQKITGLPWVRSDDRCFSACFHACYFNEQTRLVQVRWLSSSLNIPLVVQMLQFVQKEITMLSDVICFRSGDSLEEKKSRLRRSRIPLRRGTAVTAWLLLVQQQKEVITAHW